jgi:hypothetical protein
MTRRYLTATWIDPRQEIRPSTIHNLGSFAREPIGQGEPVEIIGGEVMTDGEFRAFQVTSSRFNAVQIDEGLHLVERSEVTQQRAGSLNHSCDSNLFSPFLNARIARLDQEG